MFAQPSSADPYRFVEWTGQDLRVFVHNVPTYRTVIIAAGMGGMVVLLSGQDDDLTRGAGDLAAGTYAPLRRAANEIGDVKTVQPVALMLFLGSLLSDDARLQDAAFTAVESIVISNLITNSLKGLVGRARPFQGEGTRRFRPFSGNTSFPSGHATTVFAFTTPWLLYYADYKAAGLFLMGAGTALIRMADKAHWFTDVAAGTVIGFSTAYWLTRRHQRQRSNLTVVPVVAADHQGVMIRLRL